MGAGIIIQNDRGRVIAAQSVKIIDKFIPLTAKLCIIRVGLVFASKIGVCIKIVENDSINAIAMVNSPGGLSSNDLVANDIRSLMRLGKGGTCNFIPRLGNEIAHALAKYVSSISTTMCWREEIPNCIDLLVAKDLS
ncbi:hypothetical protein TorRG33x02_258310 [Trema orientale]|uniref:RNase H type-1 domain-containing protein n=1 Tax=Trema orientale TaxID=63057 RepID=A0A2P5D9C0_TREOI|nr:hypothetical protein TorRG33x02_258310 [Trema orientale]